MVPFYRGTCYSQRGVDVVKKGAERTIAKASQVRREDAIFVGALLAAPMLPLAFEVGSGLNLGAVGSQGLALSQKVGVAANFRLGQASQIMLSNSPQTANMLARTTIGVGMTTGFFADYNDWDPAQALGFGADAISTLPGLGLFSISTQIGGTASQTLRLGTGILTGATQNMMPRSQMLDTKSFNLPGATSTKK